MRFIERILEFVTMAGFIGMLLCSGLQVLFRYALGMPLAWTEELSRVLFTSSMFLGMAIALREDEHIIVDFLFKRMPAKAQAVGNLIIYTLVFLFLIILARGTWIMIGITWESYMIAMDWMRTAYLYMVEFAAIMLMMFYTIQKVADAVKTLGSPSARTTEA
jgi:TRAP-type C4-dicarboxylate transport system permease small subunit